MFEGAFGLPLHPLAVHAAVVFVPLLALAALAYALIPKWRDPLRWVTVGLAVIAPVTVAVAALSGDAFQQRRGLPLEGSLQEHRTFGWTAAAATFVLTVASLALVWLRQRGGRSPALVWTTRVVTAVLVLAALVALVYVVRAGDTGARMVWEQLWDLTG